MTGFADIAEQAARAAAVWLRRMHHQVAVREKGPKDLVTEADLAAQSAIREVVLHAFPNHAFLGEEGGDPASLTRSSGYCWVVDPLDGTANYVHGLPNYAVSVALCRDGQLLVGVVLDPTLNECFLAEAGKGAYLNGRPIAPSNCRQLRQAMVAASFAPEVPRGSIEVRRFVEVIYEAQGIRRMGSAALNLCYVAAGRLDAYWATSVKVWDVAAGVLILQEAGALVRSIDGQPFHLSRPELLATSTDELYHELAVVLRRAEHAA